MNRYRVFYSDKEFNYGGEFVQTGRILRTEHSLKYQDDYEKLAVPEQMLGLPFVILEESEIQKVKEVKQHYIQDGKIQKDENWEILLMPIEIIKQTQKEKIKKEISEEIKKGSFDAQKVLKLQHEILELEGWTDLQIYQQALQNLEKDQKLNIQSLLQKRITELGGINGNL